MQTTDASSDSRDTTLLDVAGFILAIAALAALVFSNYLALPAQAQTACIAILGGAGTVYYVNKRQRQGSTTVVQHFHEPQALTLPTDPTPPVPVIPGNLLPPTTHAPSTTVAGGTLIQMSEPLAPHAS